jgi:hypothetical protein
MPADSDAPTGATLPVTFRPLGVRLAVIALGVMLVAVCAAVWFAFPESTRDKFTFLQRLTLLGFGLVAAVAGHAMARCRLDARADGLQVVNGYRTHRYSWGEVAGVSLRAGAPWAVLELSDGSTAAAMGIQGSDGNRAVGQVKRLRSILVERSDPQEG